MNRKIAISLLSVVGALTLVAGSAFAAFTTTATTTANTFSSTTPGLNVQVGAGSQGQVEPGVNVSGLIPNVWTAPQTFYLVNTSNDPGDDLVTTMQLIPTGANTTPGADIDISVNCGGGDITHLYNDWISGALGVGTVNHGTFLTCTMSAKLHSDAPNSDAGTHAVFDAVFTGTVGS